MLRVYGHRRWQRSPRQVSAAAETAAAGPYSDFFCGRNTFFFGSCHCAAVLFSQVQVKCTDLDLGLLYILTWGTYSKFTRENNFQALSLLSAAMLERWPQVCRVKITFTKLPTSRFVSTTKNSMKCVVNWIPLRIRVCSRNTQFHDGSKPKRGTNSIELVYM